MFRFFWIAVKYQPFDATRFGTTDVFLQVINKQAVLCLDVKLFECGLETMQVSQLRSMIKLEKIEDTRFVYVKVTAKNKQAAADIANTLASVACRYMNEQLLNDQPYTKVVNESEVPTTPSNPISKLMLLLVAVASSLLVYAVYLVLFLLDDKINSPEDVEKYLGLSTLGQIPYKHDTGRKKQYAANTSQKPLR